MVACLRCWVITFFVYIKKERECSYILKVPYTFVDVVYSMSRAVCVVLFGRGNYGSNLH